MWKRRLGAAFVLVAFWARPLAALPSDMRSLDTAQLLAEAAWRIETLQRLNERLQEQIRVSQEKSVTLEEKLASLQTDWELSEKLRQELAATLTSLRRSLQSCREEATAKARRAMLGGVAAGLAVGALMTLLWSAH
jgi:chromosome segregation ATPase